MSGGITKIAEEMIRREYRRKYLDLPAKFWNLPEYKQKYQNQMRFASKFVRTYGEEVVWNVLKKETWCFSLAAKSLPNLMEIEANRLKNKELVQEIQESRPVEKVDESVPLFRVKTNNTNKLLGE